MWVEAGFPPETFWQQTERSFSNALAGAARHRIKLAWQIAAFTGAASVGKLKAPDEYLPNDEARHVTPGSMKMIGFMRRLQHRGIPVTIERIERVH
jgi:hypothetical protein